MHFPIQQTLKNVLNGFYTASNSFTSFKTVLHHSTVFFSIFCDLLKKDAKYFCKNINTLIMKHSCWVQKIELSIWWIACVCVHIYLPMYTCFKYVD